MRRVKTKEDAEDEEEGRRRKMRRVKMKEDEEGGDDGRCGG